MGKTIEEIKSFLTNASSIVGSLSPNLGDSCREAVNIIEKYQKIEDIYYHQSGEALENSLRAVIEDGNVD